MRKLLKIGLVALSLVALPMTSFAQWMRPNNFTQAKGATRIAEIKRFQAQNNLPVTGGLNSQTQDMLTNKNLAVYDLIENSPSKGIWIAINKSRHTLTLYQGTRSIGKYPVCLGGPGTPTPSGKARIQNKHVNPAWGGMGGKYTPVPANSPNNPLGERWMGLKIPGKSGYGIHGTIKPHQIGQSVSNGCIRMFNYDVETYVFPKVPLGAPVYIGTDQELAKMGVRQIVEHVKPGQKLEKKESKNQAKPVEKKPVEEKAKEKKLIPMTLY